LIVAVSADRAVTLEDPENFRAFRLAIEGDPVQLGGVAAALRGIAVIADAQTAWVDESWLRDHTGRSDDAVWQDGVSAMLAAASTFGWYDAEQRTIRAHIVWTPTPANS